MPLRIMVTNVVCELAELGGTYSSIFSSHLSLLRDRQFTEQVESRRGDICHRAINETSHRINRLGTTKGTINAEIPRINKRFRIFRLLLPLLILIWNISTQGNP